MATTVKSVKTDKQDYAPGQTVFITADGFAGNANIQFQVVNLGLDGLLGTMDDIAYPSWIVSNGLVGNSPFNSPGNNQPAASSVATTWLVPDSALNSTLSLTAQAITAGADNRLGTADDVLTGPVAQTTFTDSNPNPLQTYFVPLPEQQVNYIFNDLENQVSDGIISVISITMSRAGTLIYYDQWENGYDADIANPANLYSAGNPGGTQIWGNNDPTDGIAPGYLTDTFQAGDSVILRNVVPTNPRGTSIFFDGGDKIGATAAVAVTRGYWPQTVEGSGGSVLGGAIEVVDTFRYGLEYKVPVGENLTNDNNMFSYAALAVSAAQNGTLVKIDVNGDGDFTDPTDVNVTLNQGQTYVVRGTGDGTGPSPTSGPGINANSRVLADKPVQVDLITGVINANFESDGYTLTPLNKLGSSYYSPVTTTGPSSGTSGAVSYFLYNPGASPISVNYETTGGTSSVNVNAGATVRYTPSVSGSGIHFYTSGATFDVIATYDSATSGYVGNNYDWGWTLTPESGLTTQVAVGWAQGSSDTNGNVVAGANGSPLWVTATANTIVYVDWDGNPANSALTAPNGQKYDIAYTVNKLQSVRLYDSHFNDSDQSGAHLFTTNGALIAVAYGEDQTQQGSVPGFAGNNAFGSTQSSPYLDVGTNVLPLPALAIKKFTNGQDADSPTGPSILVGGTATFTYNVSNNGGIPLVNVVVVDDGGAVEPSFNPAPVLSGGFNIGDTNTNNWLDPGEVWKYQASKTVTAGQYTNIATVTATDLGSEPVAPDADPSNHFGATGAVVIEKQVSADNSIWFDADDPMGPVILVGQNVYFRVAVTNNSTGNVPATVDLTDTILVGGGTARDFTFGGLPTTTVTAGDTVYSDVITETALAGQNEDQVSATATVTDGTNISPVTVTPDDANYFGATPGIAIVKEVSVDGGTTWFDANSATGPVILAGQIVSFRVKVTNTSDDSLSMSGITVTDDTGLNFTGVDSTLAAGASDYSDVITTVAVAVKVTNTSDDSLSMSGITVTDDTGLNFTGVDSTLAAGASDYSDVITTVAVAGQHTNTATASGTVTDEGGHSSTPTASDPANYFGATGAVAIEKQVSADNSTWFDADDPTGPVIAVGQNVYFRVAVTNNSTGGLAAIVDLSDTILVGNGAPHDFTFAGQQTTTVAAGDTVYSDVITETALAGQNEDQASAVATVSDGTNTTPVPVVPDDANYFGLVEKGVIGDRVWEDLNYNGIQDAGEPGLANFVVNLLDAGGNPTGLSTSTDGNGNYLFSDVVAGDYRIQVIAASGYYFTKENIGPDDRDSDVDSSGVSSIINLSAGEIDLTWDAGLYRKASLGDRVWLDRDKDGIQDANEVGVGNVSVKLLDASGAVLATTTTNVFGNYLFSNLDPGTYGLEFNKAAAVTGAISVAKYPWTIQDAGGNGSLDSDVKADPANPNLAFTTDPIVLTSGENDLTWDAGITPIVIDLNGDGIRTVSRADSQGTFDLLGTGVGISSGWLSGEDGFLVVDRNGNGRIDDISEMFGGTRKGDGFSKLSTFDSNGDGVVDASDADFASLKIWQDINGDHQTDAGELISLADAGVISLSADYSELPFLDAQGNLHLERSSATLSDGAVVDMTDVYLNVSVFDAAAAGVNLPSLADLLGGGNIVDDRWLDSELDWASEPGQQATGVGAVDNTSAEFSMDAGAAGLNDLDLPPQYACCDVL